MGRCKDFEEKEVLRRALECFWRKGYEAASTRDLAQAMGISYGSVYNTFKDKRTLYLASLDLYISLFVRPIIEKLNHATDAYAALKEIFDQVAKDAINSTCGFSGSAIFTLADRDCETAQKVGEMNQSLEAAIESLLIRSCETGNISPVNDAATLSCFMVNTISSILLATRLGSCRKKLDSIIEVSLSVLR